MVWEIAIGAAKIIASAYLDKRQNAQEAAQISALLAANNAVLIQEMERIISQEFDLRILAECNNILATLSVFYQEYANNPDDFAKLSLIEQQCQFALDKLDDPGTRFPGIQTYAATTSLRINALALKSNFQSGDKLNARASAERSRKYFEVTKPQLIEATKARVGPLLAIDSFNCSGPLGRNGVKVCTCLHIAQYTVDGKNAFARTEASGVSNKTACDSSPVGQSLRREAEESRTQKINQLVAALPLKQMEQCMTEWKNFLAL